MQHTQNGYVHTPAEFRRATGAHAIIATLLLADLAGPLLDMVMGAALGSPLWWLLRGMILFLHASLLFDSALVLIFFLIVAGIVGQSTHEKSDDVAWASLGLLIALIIVVLCILKLAQIPLLAIPASIIPAPKLEPFPWPMHFAPIGAVFALVLYLLAHLVIVRSAHISFSPDGQRIALSRAYPQGTHWTWVQKCYALYEQSLTRFQPPPIPRLKTPPTFLFFTPPDASASSDTKLERGLFWSGTSLVISVELLDPDQSKVLLPLLARSLHDYHTLNRFIEQMLLLARRSQRDAFLRIVLWLPLRAVRSCDRQWRALEKDRVLDRDRFAYWCGEGTRLRRLLRLRLSNLRSMGKPDDETPTLSERIEHLDGWLRHEARQLQELREALPSVGSSSPPDT